MPLPLVGLVVRAPWRTLPSLLSDPTIGQALRLSLVTCPVALYTAIGLVIAIGIGIMVAASAGRRGTIEVDRN